MKLLNEQKVAPLNKGEVMILLKIVEEQIFYLKNLIENEKETAFERVYQDKLRIANKSFNRLRSLYNVTKN